MIQALMDQFPVLAFRSSAIFMPATHDLLILIENQDLYKRITYKLYMMYPHASWQGDCRYRDVSRSSLSGGWIRIGELISLFFFFGYGGSSLLCEGFLLLWWPESYLLWCAGFSLQWLLLWQSSGSRCMGFSSCGPWAQLLRGMWDFPRSGIEPMSLALAGGLLTTESPGKSLSCPFFLNFFYWSIVGYNVVLLNSKSQQHDSYIYMCVCVCVYIFFFRFFSIIGYRKLSSCGKDSHNSTQMDWISQDQASIPCGCWSG